MNIEVLVEIKASNLDKTFTYSVPKEMEKEIEIGKRVRVPFATRTLDGFIIAKNVESLYEVKDIIAVLDEFPVLNNEMLELGKYIKKKTFSTLTAAYQAMLPSGLKASIKNELKIKTNTYYQIINSDIKLTTMQNEFLDCLSSGIILKSEALKISASIPKTLLKKGVLKELEIEEYRLKDDFKVNNRFLELTLKQKQIANSILESKNQFSPFLLYGVTGSGKTEIYMNVIEEVLKDKKEVIVLVPEISLTPQIIAKFKARFKENIAILHSALSDGEKFDEWRKIYRKEVSIVIGARSAVFAPFTNLGLIIIDEEHSVTYKQDNNPKYSAIDVALKRAKTYNCPLILGSATPSVESYTRAKLDIYKLLTLSERVNLSMPTIETVDMRHEYKKKNFIFSDKLIEEIKNKTSKKEQTIIFLNRRGYSTVLTCNSCGNTFKCPNCDIPLTYHKEDKSLKCHYCDFTNRNYSTCQNCHSKDINYFGLGTQKVEEELIKLIPGIRVIRMDIDTTRKKGSHSKIITSFEDNEYDVLIGTQMISKGLDFKDVTLVGVINADASLNIPDFRSAERTFQLLSQVSGRSGRSDKLGNVIIQTFNKDHYSIEASINSNYDEFYNKEIAIRKQLNYPPFCDLILIKLKTPDYEEGLKMGEKIVYSLKNKNGKILGPSAANAFKINNVYNINILIKCKKIDEFKEELENIKKLYNSKKIIIDIEFNPQKI